jgi:hypothetical protein
MPQRGYAQPGSSASTSASELTEFDKQHAPSLLHTNTVNFCNSLFNRGNTAPHCMPEEQESEILNGSQAWHLENSNHSIRSERGWAPDATNPKSFVELGVPL